MTCLGCRWFEKRVIGPDEDPLLIRWVLFRVPAFGVYLHNMRRSDYDRALHDHPWPFVSLVLRGGYWEYHDQTLDGTTRSEWRAPGSVLVRPAAPIRIARLTAGAAIMDSGNCGQTVAALGILSQRRLVLVAQVQLR